jgi:hypothetical protein
MYGDIFEEFFCVGPNNNSIKKWQDDGKKIDDTVHFFAGLRSDINSMY